MLFLGVIHAFNIRYHPKGTNNTNVQAALMVILHNRYIYNGEKETLHAR